MSNKVVKVCVDIPVELIMTLSIYSNEEIQEAIIKALRIYIDILRSKDITKTILKIAEEVVKHGG